MENTTKRNVGFISFLPFLAWMVWCAYIMIITKSLILSQTYQNHEKIVTALATHYNTITMLFTAAAIITAVVLLYFVIHLARLRSLNAPTKAVWIIFMVAFEAVAFPIFWYIQVRNERRDEETYPSIA